MKRMFVVISLALLLLAAVAMVVATGYTADKASHAALYTDEIRGKSSGSVNVKDLLLVADAEEGSETTVTLGDTNCAVQGFSFPPVQGAIGVFGGSSAAGGIGVLGQYNVNKESLGPADYAASNSNYGYLGGSIYGVYGKNAMGHYGELGTNVAGVEGRNSFGSYGRLGTTLEGVYGEHSTGVYGTLGSANYGVYGYNLGNVGALGTSSYGVYGVCQGAGCYGVYTSNKVYAGNGVAVGSSATCTSGGTCKLTDIAEDIPVADDVEAGDVVVIDPENLEHVKKSTKAYDTKVAGIVSTSPGFLIDAEDSDTPLALAGRVPTKVSAENGAIKIGDLLTTSNTPGHAMKCADKGKCFGALVGKALEPLASGKGKIMVLVTLG